MKLFKLFDEKKLKKNEKLDEVITTWLNEIHNDIKIIQINQSTDPDGHLLISLYCSIVRPKTVNFTDPLTGRKF